MEKLSESCMQIMQFARMQRTLTACKAKNKKKLYVFGLCSRYIVIHKYIIHIYRKPGRFSSVAYIEFNFSGGYKIKIGF